jgi:uncharacterized protein (TIGR02757 family)
LPGVADLARLSGADRTAALERSYHAFNRAEMRTTDPVSFVWRFESQADRECAAWVAAALSFGRVASILGALEDLNRRWEGQPEAFVMQTSVREKRNAFKGFVYRWTTAPQWVGLLDGWRLLQENGPVAERIAASGTADLRSALAPVVRDLVAGAAESPGYLVPDPAGPGACKRLAMWLRWMVRSDEIDPGLWSEHLSPAGLWVPLDTHMFRIARRLRLTRRKTADAEAARRITNAFRKFSPEDPLKYDFAITRLGMGTAS